MNGGTIRDIVDAMYWDFEWYGKFSTKETKKFMKLVAELNQEVKSGL